MIRVDLRRILYTHVLQYNSTQVDGLYHIIQNMRANMTPFIRQYRIIDPLACNQSYTSRPTLSYIPPIPNPPPAAPPLAAASACNKSETFICTSKNLAAHRSMQTPSALLISPSRYSLGIHFFMQACWSLHSISLCSLCESA